MGDPVDAVAALADPVRRALYDHVAAAGGEVSRADAAAAVGVARTVAAFHLDRLAQEGLLEVTTRRTTGRSGPGAGRPARLYRRAEREVAVSLPPRDYELAATLLAGAVEEAGVEEAVEAQARALGEQLGAQHPAADPHDLGAVERALAARGFEPYRDEAGEVRLRNCAFHAPGRRLPGARLRHEPRLLRGRRARRRAARRAGAPRPARARLLRRHFYRQQLLT